MAAARWLAPVVIPREHGLPEGDHAEGGEVVEDADLGGDGEVEVHELEQVRASLQRERDNLNCRNSISVRDEKGRSYPRGTGLGATFFY